MRLKSLSERWELSRESQTPRAAFTLIDLILSIAIVGLLVALLAPAVFRAREASRRIQCLSNLRQLGMAFTAYQGSHGHLPPAYTAIHNSLLPQFLGVAGDHDDANIHTYAEFLLPELGASSIYHAVDFNEPFFAPFDLSTAGLPDYRADNQSVIAVPVSTFLCPSAPRDTNPHHCIWSSDSLRVTYKSGGNDYGPSSGVEHIPGGLADSVQFPKERLDGILSNNFPQTKLDDAIDGTMQTALMWEIAGRPDLYHLQESTGLSTGGGGWADIANAENWFKGASSDGATLIGPCAINCTNAAEAGVYSFHEGGTHVLLCDGSAKLVSESMSVENFINLVTREGHRAVLDF
jgi:type II secretory pathway pseudopilin PulG